MAKPLVVYKASAGSGKTFTLAVEYIKLLIQNPLAFRQTLAVTFTNKATEEMKTRILSQLYGIWQRLDSSRQYTQKVCRELGVTEEQASIQAGISLRLLLHNYSYFRVETIDSFFQSVLRNLARELELSTNLRIELNDSQVEEIAVDQIIDSLQKGDKVLRWLMQFIMDNISDDHSWNVIGQVKQFGKTIFRDYYKQESRELNKITSEKDFFEHYTTQLRHVRSEAQEYMQQLAAGFFDTIHAEGLDVDDFANKSRGVCSIFLKMQNGVFDESVITKTVADTVGQPSKWYAKSSPNAEKIHALVEDSLNGMLRRAIEEQPRQWRLYKSADLTLRHISQLRLLSTIETRIREMNEEANRFLLSDTQQFLHDVICESDTPFIYEKMGTQLEHIMIDEFQDTSTTQWRNFSILLNDVMSHKGAGSLIVGDVKQSIYRWRSGDWRLLANIKQQFKDAEQLIEIKPLDTNYRSSRNIIEFNNAFFTEAARQEEVDAYDDVKQKWPEGKPSEGLVSIRLLPQDGYADATLDAIAGQTEWLISQGVKQNEIAILMRSNVNIPLIANYLMARMPDINVVSDEAFRLDASPAVMVLVKALYYLYNPDDCIVRAFLAKATTGKPDGQLPEEYAAHSDELRRLPLYQLMERLFGIFLDPQTSHTSPQASPTLTSQDAYLCAFFDKVAEFANDRGDDAVAFLHNWDESLCSKTIQCPEINGLRIISIHKSKGLEFPHVIIPFCDWRMEHNDILWCKPLEAPFNRLPLAPIDYSQKGMKGTIYEKDYDEEHGQNTVDNLNLLYVAFTRASSSLFVIGKRGSKSSRSALIEQVLPQLELDGATFTNPEDCTEPIDYSFGCLPAPQEHLPKEEDNTNPFLQKSTPIDVNVRSFSMKTEFMQSNKSRQFAAATEDEEEGSEYINLGLVLHNIFSTIRTTADTDNALEQLESEGILYSKDITRQKLENMIRKRIADPRVADWFSSRWTLYNECNILLPDGQTRRPDRVMTDGSETIVVDFKFGNERDEYHQQVREYITLLRKMGMQQVRGYLWFVYSNKIVEVKEVR